MTKEETNWEEEFVEKGADLEHIRWAKWQEHFFSKCKTGRIDEEDKDVVLILPRDLYDRWWRQINTIYSELSEAEKESDRREVRQYLPLIAEIISQEREKWNESVIKMLENTDVQMSVNGNVSEEEKAMAKFLYKAHMNHIKKRLQKDVSTTSINTDSAKS